MKEVIKWSRPSTSLLSENSSVEQQIAEYLFCRTLFRGTLEQILKDSIYPPDSGAFHEFTLEHLLQTDQHG